MTVGAPARLVLATANPHKLIELTRILAGGHVDVELASLADFPGAPDVAETGATFAENALLKARAIAAFTGLPAVSDDSGLCADAHPTQAGRVPISLALPYSLSRTTLVAR